MIITVLGISFSIYATCFIACLSSGDIHLIYRKKVTASIVVKLMFGASLKYSPMRGVLWVCALI